MATYDPRAFRRPAWTDRCASGGRSGNRRGKNPARERIVRRHFPAHVSNERGGLAARQTHARNRTDWDAGGAACPKSARICDAGPSLNEIRTCCVIASADLITFPPFSRWRMPPSPLNFCVTPKPEANRETSMPADLPTPIATYIGAANRGETEALAQCFAESALVRDEGKTIQGLAAIKKWMVETKQKYQHTIEPLASTQRDGKTN